jgi:hypothetical protein
MPQQQGEPVFAPDERLFRHLRKDWIDDHGRITEDAVDLLGTSVDREAIARDPESCWVRASSDVVAIGAITFSEIPDRFEGPPVKPPANPPAPYESVVKYLPENGNDAHSEIQFRRQGETEKSKPQSKAIKSEIRDRLAKLMRVVCRRSEA